MASLVPYIGSNLIRGMARSALVRYNPRRARYISRAGRLVVGAARSAGPGVRRYAARAIQRTFRGFLARRRRPGQRLENPRRHIGEPNRGGPPAKRDTMLVRNTQLYNTRQLYLIDITDIERESTVNALNFREKDEIHLSGFKINSVFRNLNATVPLIVNICAVVPKKDNAISNVGFFRDYATSRDIDFSSFLASQDMNNLPINPDKYGILFRHKFELSASTNVSNYSVGSSKSYKHFVRWVKINRRIQFDSGDLDSAEKRVFIVWWCDNVIQGASVQTNQVASEQNIVTFFHEVK